MNDTLNQKENLKEPEKKEAVSDTLNLHLTEDDKLVKQIDHETLLLYGDAYKIVENYRDAVDLELIESRYSDFLEKYDYIVGDIAYEKLRLRGFYYSKNKKVPIDMRISSLKDYLTEYCSFGCAYFVLERMKPKKKTSSQTKRKSKPSQNKKNTQNKKQINLRKFDQAKKQEEKGNTKNQKHNQNKNQNQTTDQNKKTFIKKGRKPQEQLNKKAVPQSEENKVKTVKNQKGETKFKIRQKNKPE